MNVTTFVLANLASLTVILAFIWRFVIQPVNERAEALDRMQQSVQDIQKELHPNGGTSLKDAVTRTELRQAHMGEDVKRIERKMDSHIDFHMGEKN